MTIERTAAWIEPYTTAEPDEEERLLILKELANVGVAAGSRALLCSLAQDWADDAAMLLMEILTHRSAGEVVQKKYFDGHGVLHLHIEEAMETTIQLILEAVATFDEYISTEGNGLTERRVGSRDTALPDIASQARNDALRIDVEAISSRASEVSLEYVASQWIKEAKDKATADLLEETGEHGHFLWERFRENVGVKPPTQ